MAELTRTEKVSFILKTELEITKAVNNGFKPHDSDEFEEKRQILREYRKELYGNVLKNKNYRSVNQIF
jgi:hypothetical protein